MADSTQEALLLAIAGRDDLFDMFEEMFSSDNYHRVLMAFREGMQYADISREAGVAEGTVSNAFKELEDYGLIEKDDDGNRRHTMPVLTHPIIQYYYLKEVIGDE